MENDMTMAGKNARNQAARSSAGPGGRHDNDKADIREIQIMPTYDEIVSSRPPYLPAADPKSWHVHGIDGVIDRQFRLLREDTVGGLRDAVKSELMRLRGQTDTHDHDTTKQAIHTNSYQNAVVKQLNARVQPGFQFEVEFDQPGHLVDLTQEERYEWWECARRLRHEHVVCILDISGMILFCVVNQASSLQQRTTQRPDDRLRSLTVKLGDDDAQSSNAETPRAAIKLSLIGRSHEEIATLLYHFHNGCRSHSTARRSIVEFPQALLPAFLPSLLRLQRMYASDQVACSDLIAPDLESISPTTAPLPPAYSLRPDFKFNIGCLTTKQEDVWLDPQQPFGHCLESLRSFSTLDDSQATALCNALTRRIAIVQGPPGTGKSFTGVAIIKSLLASKISLGPILTVTYTNHAVDQLLEHLLDAGIQQLVRVGGYCSSQRLESKKLQKLNTWATAEEKADRSKLNRELENNVGSRLRTTKADISKVDNWDLLEAHLRSHEPRHFTQMYGNAKSPGDQFRNAKGELVRAWIRSHDSPHHPARPLSELKDADLHKMSLVERHNLFESWRKAIVTRLNVEGISLIERALFIKDKLTEASDDKSYRALAKADVIGLTTSGLAKRISLLRRTLPKVLIIEEAAEVLEAHTLTAFLPSIEHIILIGDHQQLAPHISSYEMSRFNPAGNNVAFDVSLFERLVQPQCIQFPQLPFDTLRVQRRMYPSISQLIRIHQYPQLQNHSSVADYPEVVGIRSRLFWLHHDELEDGENHLTPQPDPTETSHSNAYEVSMVTALVRHFVRQGTYKFRDIAVLTPYLGQLLKLRQALQDLFEVIISNADENELGAIGFNNSTTTRGGSTTVARNLFSAVRLSTVDNFQGEEADVVIISLVRSNKDNICGFLRTDNRVNVMLSRARHGMYIIGNARTASSGAGMMESTLLNLHQSGLFGPRLELVCPQHPTTGISIRSPEDFDRYSPDGGCHLPCARPLPCGHVCPAFCHAEYLHQSVKCQLPCERPKSYCGHSCKKVCGIACDSRCSEIVKNAPHLKLKLPCGHSPSEGHIECWQLREPSSATCDQLQSKVLPGCKHRVEVACSVDVASPSFICLQACGRTLSCGHRCREICGRCPLGRSSARHSSSGNCQQTCGRKLPACGHVCHSVCHSDQSQQWPCPPCNICEVFHPTKLLGLSYHSTKPLAITAGSPA